MSAVVLVVGASGALAIPAHADGPLGNSLDGLNQLQGIQFGDLSGVVDPHSPEAQPPASTIESPAIPTTNAPAGVPAPTAPAAAPPPAPSSAPEPASLQLPATGIGAHNSHSTAIPALTALLALAGIITLAASRHARSHTST